MSTTPEVGARASSAVSATYEPVVALVFWQWRPIPTVLWRVDDKVAQAGLWALFASGWTLVVAMTCAIDHFGMFVPRPTALRRRGGDG